MPRHDRDRLLAKSWVRLVAVSRHYATTRMVAGMVLAGAAAGCSGQPAVADGSANSCFQFAVSAIQRHVTVTAVPSACQGPSQNEVNVAVGRALRAAAAGVRGKVGQRELIARDKGRAMNELHADDAAEALAEIQRRQQQVIDQATVPGWYWWSFGALMVVLAVGVDTSTPAALGGAIAVFVVGLLAATGLVVRSQFLRARLRNRLLDGREWRRSWASSL